MADLTVNRKINQWNEYSKKLQELVKKYDALLTNAVKLNPPLVPKFDKEGHPIFVKNEDGTDSQVQEFDATSPMHPIYGRPATKDEIDGHMQEFDKLFAAIINEIQSLKL